MELEKKSGGAVVGLVVIVVILIVGGIYIWMSNRKIAGPTGGAPLQPEAVTNGDAAELNALEQDMNETDTSTGVDVNTVD